MTISALPGSQPGPASSAALLEHRSEVDGNRVFLRFEERSWTYTDARREVSKLAGGFASAGIGRGDRVALMLPNAPEFVFASIAVSWLGAVEVPVNTELKGGVLRHQIDNSGLSFAVVHEDLLEGFLSAGDGLLGPGRVAVAGHSPNTHDVPFSELAAHEPIDRATAAESDLSAIMYTSGTTGNAKGVEVTYGHAHRFASDWIRAVEFTRDDVLMTPLPLFHSIARTLGVLPTLILGAQICLVERFSASNFWDQVRHFDPTVVHGIFGMVPILLNQPERAHDRDHRVSRYYIGPNSLSDAFEKRFGARVIELYGATETGIVTYFAPGDEVRPGSCGRANEDTYEVTLLDDHDHEVPDGEIGEFVVRPRAPWSLLTGYYANQAETLAAFRNLWFHTGDYGRRDVDGYFYFVDRKKDAIRRRGENITSGEVETEVNAHPAVLECAVIAVPSELGEDEVKACVVLRPGFELDPADLIAFLDPRLPYFMVPRYIEILDELPKTANGKIQKHKLRDGGTRGITSDTWDREEYGIELTRTRSSLSTKK
ncbi:AMP-binding protein [Nocardia gamkensis]|uniref:AMP-binding protein n=1 Tax=Nocardia gamkensis TaxID=352869 RepID=UPI0037C75B57